MPSPQGLIAQSYITLVTLLTWLVCNTYAGIWHDARIYLITAYYSLSSASFVNDPWFQFGSQASFSIFGPLYALLLSAVGVGQGAALTTLLGGVVWSLSVAWLTQNWLDKGAWVASLILLGLPLSYEYTNSDLLVLTENFATARPYAFALGVAAIAALSSGRSRLGVFFSLAACTLHPLFGIWVVLAAVCYRWPDKYIALVLIGLLGIFCMVAVNPYTLILQPMSESWYRLVQETSAIVLPKGVSHIAWDRHLAWFAVLLLAYQNVQSDHARWYAVAALISSWALLLSLVVSLYLPLAFLVKVQPWRGLWLSVVLGVLALVAMWQQWAKEGQSLFIRSALVLMVAAAGSGTGFILWILWFWGRLFQRNRSLNFADWLERYATSRIKAVVLTGLALIVLMKVAGTQPSPVLLPWAKFSIQWIYVVPYLDIALVILVIVALNWLPQAWQRTGILCLLVSLALWGWDQRTPEQVALENRYSLTSSAEARAVGIERGDVVYWPNNENTVWYRWATASYYSSTQAIGIVFSEEHAMLMYQRAKKIQSLTQKSYQSLLDSKMNLHAPQYHPGQLNVKAIKELCQDPALDYIVDATPPIINDSASYLGLIKNRNLWVHNCRLLRSLNL